jgi:ribonucleotide reductase alpha subunit
MNGTSNGIIPMLRVFNDTARNVNQGGGKRKGGIFLFLLSILYNARAVLEAQKLWFAILEAQVETGNPNMLFKVRIFTLSLTLAVG